MISLSYLSRCVFGWDYSGNRLVKNCTFVCVCVCVCVCVLILARVRVYMRAYLRAGVSVSAIVGMYVFYLIRLPLFPKRQTIFI